MRKKYNIHPDFARYPSITIKFGALSLWLINCLMKLQCFFVKRRLKLIVKDHSVPGAAGNQIKLSVLKPSGLGQSAPALLYYHGGGFGITYTSLHFKNCERYATEAGCVVIFVDYRLAPRRPFPAGFDDCYGALAWTVQNAESLGINASKIAVGGDSAGGALAAGVAQKARDEGLIDLCAQLLIYPVLDNTCSTPSATDFTDTPLWNAISNRNMWDMYLRGSPEGAAPLYAAPGHGDLHDLPLSYVETAEFDPLRDEGLQYAAGLKQQGIEVALNETAQTIHGYDAKTTNGIARHSMLERIAFLTRAFA